LGKRFLEEKVCAEIDQSDANFIPIRLQTWQPQVILVSDWSISEKIFSSQTASQIKMKLGRQHG
jgi:hypothetical protein